MLPEYAKANIEDIKGKNDIQFETNFSEDPDLKEYVRVTLDGNSAVISIKDLFAFVFTVANEEQQVDLMPVVRTTVKKMVKYHKVLVANGVKPGGHVNVRCEVNVPVEVYNGMRGNLSRWEEKKGQPSSIIVPSMIK